jgi:hypothetical protein
MISFPTNVLEATLETIILPSFLKTIISSMSEQSVMYSSLRNDVPIKPSSLFTYNFVFLITTLVATISWKLLISRKHS